MLAIRRPQSGRLAAVLAACCFAASAVAAPDARGVFKAPPSVAARQMIHWVLQSGDAAGRPFAIVDTRAARIHVFDARGVPRGESVVLLGQTRGDFTVPGVGERAQAGTVRPDERTTPAGRFEAEAGLNAAGEHVVWADYASAFAIHRLRPGRSLRGREARLASVTAEDNRASWGCVVVPVAFYKGVVEKVLGGRSILYVLPESRSLDEYLARLAQGA